MTIEQFYKIISAVLAILIAFMTIHNFLKSNKKDEQVDNDEKITNAIKVGLQPTTIEITRLNGFIEGILKTAEELKESDFSQSQAIVEIKQDIARHDTDIKNLYKTTNNLQKLHME